jgi:hypothetical protein
MLFDSLTTDQFKILMSSLLVCSVFYGWAMDAILGRFSFGVVPTSFFACIGGYAGLRAMDWAVLHHHVRADYVSPTSYVAAATATVTFGLIVLCFMRRVVR